MEAKGLINVYVCNTCGGETVTVNLDEGVTPMFLNCRAQGVLKPCGGRASSCGYQVAQDQVPTHGFYRPASPPKDPDTRRHVEQGGLLLRALDNLERERSRPPHEGRVIKAATVYRHLTHIGPVYAVQCPWCRGMQPSPFSREAFWLTWERIIRRWDTCGNCRRAYTIPRSNVDVESEEEIAASSAEPTLWEEASVRGGDADGPDASARLPLRARRKRPAGEARPDPGRQAERGEGSLEPGARAHAHRHHPG